MDHAKLQKLLRLLMLLTGSRRYTLSELSGRFEMSERTLYRYLDTIEDAGFVLNRSGGTYLLKTEASAVRSLQKLLHFSEEEAYILLQTLSLIESSSPIKERLLHKLNTLYDFRALAQLQQKTSIEIVQKLHDAIKEKRQAMLFAYRSSNSQTITDRVIEPFDFSPDYAAVWCYDAKANGCKQFKIARMQNVEPLTAGWRFEDKHLLPFTDVFRMAAAAPITTIKATLSLKAWNLLIEEYPLASQYIIPGGKEYLLQVPVANFNGIGRFVLGLAGEVKVHGPKRFINFLRERVRKFDF